MEWDTYTGIFIILGMLHINYSVIFNSRKLALVINWSWKLPELQLGIFFRFFKISDLI